MGGTTLEKPQSGDVLVQDVIRQIEAGELAPGAPVRSANELAGRYGISYVAAHKALQRLAREGYCVRLRRKGTFVSEHPMAARISSIAIPAYLEANPFHAHMIEELTGGAARRGIRAIVGRGDHFGEFVERVMQRGAQGIVRFTSDLNSERASWQLIQERKLACVMVNDFWFDGGPFPSVRTDEEAGVRDMMEHLISLGHRRILYVDDVGLSRRNRAFENYRWALAAHGLPWELKNVVPIEEWPMRINDIAAALIERGTAALVMYDVIAVRLAQRFKEMGVVLGKDFSLAGFDGIREAETWGLSTVVQPMSELVDTAYALLQNPRAQVTPKVVLKPTCVFRSSTGSAPDRQ